MNTDCKHEQRISRIETDIAGLGSRQIAMQADLDNRIDALSERVNQQGATMSGQIAVIQHQLGELCDRTKERHSEVMKSLDGLNSRWWTVATMGIGILASAVISLIIYIWIGAHP